ncbi:MAG: hypothetical protein ACRDGV_07250 [Candidatus Limnocylindria bacterium]
MSRRPAVGEAAIPVLGATRSGAECWHAVLFYGEEIGRGNDQQYPKRDAVRTAMQWSVEPHGYHMFGARARS